MRSAAATVVFAGGFIMMVLEVIGARLLAKDFGSSFHVWVSQIGVVMIALTAGYYLGGALADRHPRAVVLTWLLCPAGLALCFLPDWAPLLLDFIIQRHPLDQPIPAFWQKLDPVLGSALVFLAPCAALATLSPFMIRFSTRSMAQIGRSSGLVIAASTLGSIAGVFISGFVLIDHFRVSVIFRSMGVATILLGVLCLGLDPGLSRAREPDRTPE